MPSKRDVLAQLQKTATNLGESLIKACAALQDSNPKTLAPGLHQNHAFAVRPHPGRLLSLYLPINSTQLKAHPIPLESIKEQSAIGGDGDGRWLSLPLARSGRAAR